MGTDRQRFEAGDEVTDGGAGRGVIILSRPRRTDGARFPLVRITAGPDAGVEEWPGQKWRPLLDYDPQASPGTRAHYKCDECERWYWALNRRGLCAQCLRRLDRRDAQETSGLIGSATFARRRR